MIEAAAATAEIEAATGGVLYKKVFLQISQNFQENTCASVSFFKKKDFIKKETLVQVFSWEFCKICNNVFFTEHLWATASVENQLGKYSRK